jgi:hypothetical protein
MSEKLTPPCPECISPETLDRRNFIRVAGGAAAALTVAGTVAAPRLRAREDKPAKPAEDLVKELYSTLTNEQKKIIVHPWDDPKRSQFFNAAMGKNIGSSYTKAQQELLERILKSISSGEDGMRCLSRGGTWDMSNSFQGCGADIFGDPSTGKFAWVFTGHHLTVRCDGDSEEGPAFGGPIYYGHSPNGYSDRNIFHFQTKAVLSVFDALSEKQRKVAIVTTNLKEGPGEGEKSVRLKGKDAPKPGLSYGEMNKDQQGLVETVMRTLLSPYRKADVDEVMQVIKTNGGMEKLHLAFYPDQQMNDDQKWHFWRLEGPGFVWNFRVLPHVHTYVNISTKV